MYNSKNVFRCNITEMIHFKKYFRDTFETIFSTREFLVLIRHVVTAFFIISISFIFIVFNQMTCIFIAKFKKIGLGSNALTYSLQMTFLRDRTTCL